MDHEHLLGKSESDGNEEAVDHEYPHKTTVRGSKRRISWSMVAVHAGLIALYSLITFVIIWSVTRQDHHRPQGHSEVFRAIDGLSIRLNESNTEIHEMSGYHGTPNADMDRLWETLLASRFIAVSSEELERNERTSVAIKPGGPYLAWLGIFHELHCLDYIRKFVHHGYYHPNMTSQDYRKLRNHSDHCMDRIQAVLMCHPDYSTLTTMRWTMNDPKPMVDGVRTMRSCVDWGSLIESLQDRVVAEDDLRALRNPRMSG